ncbi:sterol desaturase family protein [Ramlibacter sp. H39-3-26]|uniref:sterol desaturase family protein n=1 Tax=Curvibacter soli TaxID=3031331 RepID=UPI0023DA9718|nr:sterol desaturase family protein [Ramlibacter sp. H39-3-26]MDF1484903.1 sterol desaturase family protein [Ramlibacter sp. H39-3-26]
MPARPILDAAGAPAMLPWLGALLLAVPAAAMLEGLVLTGMRRAYDWRACAASMVDMLVRRGVDALGLSLAAPLLALAYAHRLQTIALATPLAFALLFVGAEFFYYWFHRAAHRVRWFWATHAVHHSSNELTLAAALRLGWTGKLSGTGVFFAPLIWLGFPPRAVFAALALNLLYQFWLHAPWMPRLGPLEWVLNTPTHHKAHHASNPAYLDCNYGGALIVFDRLFGTFVDLRADEPLRYGLTTPLASHNPLRIALHEWLRLGADLRAAPGWRARLAVLLGPPA